MDEQVMCAACGTKWDRWQRRVVVAPDIHGEPRTVYDSTLEYIGYCPGCGLRGGRKERGQE